MKNAVLLLFALCAFAGNSVLTRWGIDGAGIGPMGFALIRTIAAAAALIVFCVLTQRRRFLPGKQSLVPSFWLVLYLIPFSIAYEAIEAGAGALLLFGVVQVTMFVGAIARGEKITFGRYGGTVVAIIGLVLLAVQGADVPSPWAVLMMCFAGIGWGLYSLAGQKSQDAIRDTTQNFVLATPILALGYILVPDPLTGQGIWIAVASGVVASAFGYVLWFLVLPRLLSTTAAIAQLTVPIIAGVAGFLFLKESMTITLLISGVLVLGGALFAITRASAQN